MTWNVRIVLLRPASRRPGFHQLLEGKIFKQIFISKKTSPCQEVGKGEMPLLFQGHGFQIHLVKMSTMLTILAFLNNSILLNYLIFLIYLVFPNYLIFLKVN